jgi:hypothetical protein
MNPFNFNINQTPPNSTQFPYNNNNNNNNKNQQKTFNFNLEGGKFDFGGNPQNKFTNNNPTQKFTSGNPDSTIGYVHDTVEKELKGEYFGGSLFKYDLDNKFTEKDRYDSARRVRMKRKAMKIIYKRKKNFERDRVEEDTKLIENNSETVKKILPVEEIKRVMGRLGNSLNKLTLGVQNNVKAVLTDTIVKDLGSIEYRIPSLDSFECFVPRLPTILNLFWAAETLALKAKYGYIIRCFFYVNSKSPSKYIDNQTCFEMFLGVIDKVLQIGVGGGGVQEKGDLLKSVLYVLYKSIVTNESFKSNVMKDSKNRLLCYVCKLLEFSFREKSGNINNTQILCDGFTFSILVKLFTVYVERRMVFYIPNKNSVNVSANIQKHNNDMRNLICKICFSGQKAQSVESVVNVLNLLGALVTSSPIVYENAFHQLVVSKIYPELKAIFRSELKRNKSPLHVLDFLVKLSAANVSNVEKTIVSTFIEKSNLAHGTMETFLDLFLLPLWTPTKIQCNRRLISEIVCFIGKLSFYDMFCIYLFKKKVLLKRLIECYSLMPLYTKINISTIIINISSVNNTIFVRQLLENNEVVWVMYDVMKNLESYVKKSVDVAQNEINDATFIKECLLDFLNRLFGKVNYDTPKHFFFNTKFSEIDFKRELSKYLADPSSGVRDLARNTIRGIAIFLKNLGLRDRNKKLIGMGLGWGQLIDKNLTINVFLGNKVNVMNQPTGNFMQNIPNTPNNPNMFNRNTNTNTNMTNTNFRPMGMSYGMMQNMTATGNMNMNRGNMYYSPSNPNSM